MKKYLESVQHKKTIAKQYVTTKILRQLSIFAIIIAIILVIGIYRILSGDLSLIEGGLALFLGTGVGYLAGRTYRIFWHTETEKVMSQMDTLGIFFLIIYVAIEIGKSWFFGHWLSGVELNAFVLIFLGGLLAGRYLSMYYAIRGVLREEHQKRKL